MNTSDFDYHLPQELIAQDPPPNRTDARMMVINRAAQSVTDAGVASLHEYLDEGDLLLSNNTRVFPARTTGQRKDTGGRVELLFLEEIEKEASREGVCTSKWLCIFGSRSKTRAGQNLQLCGGAIDATIVEVLDQGHVEVAVRSREPILDVLERDGQVPLPPYIARSEGGQSHADRERYQTVYASELGAVAAPTAGLHFTPALLQGLQSKGVRIGSVTLHVGPGTFLPVKVENVEDHNMHAERCSISQETADLINEVREQGRRVVAVGTTTARTVEGIFAMRGAIETYDGTTNIFIYPPFEFQVVDAFLTNFHLPRSTLLMMIAAFAGREFILDCYARAVREKYRFYSYGDCMLIL